MGTLGKILLVINLLVGGAVFYFALQDWANRQNVNYVATLYQTVISGLPLTPSPGEATEDRIPFAVSVSGGYTTSTVPPKFFQDHFKGADGGATYGGGASAKVYSQLDEIKRVQAKIEEELQSRQADPAAQLAFLIGKEEQARGRLVFVPGILMNLAKTYDERSLLRTLARPQDPTDPDPVRLRQRTQQNLDTAKAMLEKYFAAVLGSPDTGLAQADATRIADITAKIQALVPKIQATRDLVESPKLNAQMDQLRKQYLAALTDLHTAATHSDADRRHRIAHLLTFLDKTADWQKRVALVVGLETYREVIASHSDRLKRMISIAEAQILHDQSSFTTQYTLLQREAERRTLLLKGQQDFLADLQAQAARDKTAIKAENDYLKTRQGDFATATMNVGTALAEQSKLEDELFSVQKKVGETLRQNFDLEDRLAAAENHVANTRAGR